MNITKSLRSLQRTLDQHSPVVLTAIAVTGVCATAWLAATGGYKAKTALGELSADEHVDEASFTNKDRFVHTYQFYAPAAVCLVGTSVCMVMATKIGLNRTAAVTGALLIAERSNAEYREKTKELFGINKATKVDDGVAADQVTNTAVPATIVMGEGDQLFFDRRNGRYFPTTRNQLDRDVNFFNQDILLNDYAALNDFYKQLGLPEVDGGNEMGWSRKNLVELQYTTALKGDRAVQAFAFVSPPMPGFQEDYE